MTETSEIAPCAECVALGLDPAKCPAPRGGRFPRTAWRKRLHALVNWRKKEKPWCDPAWDCDSASWNHEGWCDSDSPCRNQALTDAIGSDDNG